MTGRSVTPSQTVGPFFSFGLLRPPQAELVSRGTEGSFLIEGTIFDGDEEPVPDALVEIWQAAPSGRYAHPADWRKELAVLEGFSGFGRNGTDDTGRFWFRTVKPGRVPWPDGREQAPHIDISVFARGLLNRLVTRLYFPDEEEANSTDPLLASVTDSVSRATLIAHPQHADLRFDVHLQGSRQTCFFLI